MNLSNNELDQLFENVRKEKPVASFEETQRAFIAATIASAGGVLATKSLLKLFTFKQWIMMISVLSAATVGTLLVTMSATPDKTPENSLAEVKNTAKEIIEITNSEDVIASNAEENKAIIKLGPSMPEMEIVTEVGRPPIMVRAYLKDNGTYHFEYFITQETSEEDLKKLQAEAKAAGFELKYEPTYSDEKLTRLNLQIVQVKENGQRQNVQISDIDLKENSNFKVAWNVNDDGNATTIACGEDLRLKEIDQQEIDELMAEIGEINMDELNAEMEILQENLARELAEIDIARDLQIAEIEQLIQAEELLAQVQLDEILSEIDGIDEEVMEEVRERMEDARAELEKQREHLKEECETARKSCEAQKRNCDEGSKAIREELVKDGLIDADEKKIKMKGSKGKLKVNGKDIPRDLSKKYKDLVKKYFDIDANNKDTQWFWEHEDDDF